MRTPIRPLAIGVAIAMSTAGPGAQAALLAQDLLSAGDGLVTLDTATGLQWLDLGLSVPWRIDEPSSYLAAGWSVASLAQVQTLIGNHFGSSTTNGTRISVDVAGAQQFVGLLGPTFGSDVSWGRFQSTLSGRAGQAVVRYDTGLGSYLISDDGFGASEPHSFSGIFYVRPAPAPEPVLLSGQGSPSAHAALAGGTVIDFESHTAGDSAGAFGYGGVVMTGNNLLRISDAYDGQFNVTGKSLALTTQDRTQQLEFDFADPVGAFGFNFGGTDETWRLVAYASDGSVLAELDLPQIQDGNGGDWRGIQAQGIASATLYNTAFDVGTDSGDLDYIVLDNFTYLAAPVPEPQTYALMLAGLGFVRLVARRRKS